MNVNLKQHFQINLAQHMRRANVTQSELARQMGVTPAAVGEYFHGRTSPGLDVLERFAHALKINPLALLLPPDPAATPAQREEMANSA